LLILVRRMTDEKRTINIEHIIQTIIKHESGQSKFVTHGINDLAPFININGMGMLPLPIIDIIAQVHGLHSLCRLFQSVVMVNDLCNSNSLVYVPVRD
jgi:hypothetical protein